MKWLSIFFAALVLPACGETEDEVILLAAASMEPYLAPVLEQRVGVSAAYGASGALARQMELGVPAEVVILADRADGERLSDAGVLEPGTLAPYLSNRLVLISARPDLENSRLTLDGLATATVDRIAVGDPDLAPVGRYIREALAARGLHEILEPRLVPVQNARVVWSAVTSRSCDAGFLYATDVIDREQARVLFEVDPSLHRPILYVIGLRAGASAAGRRLYEDLRSPEVLERLFAAGFRPPAEG